jgi:hypothetical protein
VHNSKWQELGSTLAMILGACAVGKSTLTRAVCGASHENLFPTVAFEQGRKPGDPLFPRST